MKKLFLFAAAALLFSAAGNAQVKRNSPRSQTMQSDSSRHYKKQHMMEGLNLTADQKAQMNSLHQENKQQRDAIKNDGSLTPEQKKEKMKELHINQENKMNQILTPEQQATWKANKQKMKQNRKMNGKRHMNGNKAAQSAQQQSS